MLTAYLRGAGWGCRLGMHAQLPVSHSLLSHSFEYAGPSCPLLLPISSHSCDLITSRPSSSVGRAPSMQVFLPRTCSTLRLAYLQRTYNVLTAYLQHTYSILTAYLQHTYSVLTAYLPRTYRVLTATYRDVLKCLGWSRSLLLPPRPGRVQRRLECSSGSASA